MVCQNHCIKGKQCMTIYMVFQNQLKPLSFGSPPMIRRGTDDNLYGSDGLRRVPPPDVDGEYVRQSNGIYFFQANGPAAGPVRIFSRTARGPGAQWGRNKKCIEMVIVPRMDKSPAKENSCSLVEIEGCENTRGMLAGVREGNDVEDGTTAGVTKENAAEAGNNAAETNPSLTAGEKRQVSTESLQPALKRQRPEEF